MPPKKNNNTPKKVNEENKACSTNSNKLSSESGNENVKISIGIVKEMMKIQQDAMLSCFSSMLNNLTQKVDTIMCDVQDLKSSMSFCGGVNEEKFVNIQSEITLIKDDIFKRNTVNNADTEKLLEHSNKLVDLEDRSRRNNLRIDGVKESKGETWEQCQHKVEAIFNGQLRIEEEI